MNNKSGSDMSLPDMNGNLRLCFVIERRVWIVDKLARLVFVRLFVFLSGGGSGSICSYGLRAAAPLL